MVTYMELSVGGFGWIPNLLVPDESLILPVSLGLINLAIVEVEASHIFIKFSVMAQSGLCRFFKSVVSSQQPVHIAMAYLVVSQI
jgi:inner membrane protein COX18